MPKLNKPRVKHRMAELNVTSTRNLAKVTEIPWGSLKNALAGRDPLTLPRVYRLAEHLARKGEDVRTVVADILGTNDGVPDEPPKQPSREPKGPPRRQETEPTKGPRRARTAA